MGLAMASNSRVWALIGISIISLASLTVVTTNSIAIERGEVSALGSKEILCIADSCMTSEIVYIEGDETTYLVYMPPGLDSNKKVGTQYYGLKMSLGR